jgi:hypothetical protein
MSEQLYFVGDLVRLNGPGILWNRTAEVTKAEWSVEFSEWKYTVRLELRTTEDELRLIQRHNATREAGGDA